MGGKETNKDLLEAQIEWLRKLSSQMDTLLSVQKDIKAILTTTETKQMPPEYCKSLESNIREIRNEVKSYTEHYVAEKNKSTLTQASFQFKKTIAKEWSKYLNTRKIAYYNKKRAEGIASIYSSFLEKDPPFIPRKFREKSHPGQSEDQTSLKLDLSKRKVSIEIKRLQEQAVKQDSILTETERAVESLIKKTDDVNIQQTLKEHWIKSVKQEEEKSLVIWEKRKEWFEKLPEETTDSQPQRDQPNDAPRRKFPHNIRRDRTNQDPPQRGNTQTQRAPPVQNNRQSYANVV